MEYQTIDRNELKRMLSTGVVDNNHSRSGLAVVNVLGRDAFQHKHIPHSINIPIEEIERFEQNFSKDKEIVVYCASGECDASPRAARALSKRGFRNVYDYEGGVADWEENREQIAGSATLPSHSAS